MNFDDINWDDFDFEKEKDDFETLGFDLDYQCELIIARNNNIKSLFDHKFIGLLKDISHNKDLDIVNVDRKYDYINIEKGFGIMDTIQTEIITLNLKGKKSQIDKVIDIIKSIPLQHYNIPLKTSCQRL